MIRQNLGYKLMALAAAIGLWFYVTGENMGASSTPVSVKLATQNVPAGLLVANVPESVMVTFPKGPLPSNFRGAVQAYVDLSEAKKGSNLLDVQTVPSNKNGFAISVSPSTVMVTLDEKQQRRLPITCEPKGTAPSGYRFEIDGIEPSRAMVTGFSSSLKKVSSLVVSVDANGRYDLDGWYPVKPLDSSRRVVPGVIVKPDTVRVVLTTRQVDASKVLVVSPRVGGTLNPNLALTDIQVEPSEVTVSGSSELLAKINLIRTQEVDLSSVSGSMIRKANLVVPSGLKLDGPSEVQVNIKVEPRPLQ